MAQRGIEIFDGYTNLTASVATATPASNAAALVVRVAGGGSGNVVDQGAAGVDPWLVTGSLSITPQISNTGTTTSVVASATNVVLLASNSNRLGATIFNDSTANLYVKLGTIASTSSFTVIILPSGYYEVPFSYVAEIDGIWASATGHARVTELT